MGIDHEQHVDVETLQRYPAIRKVTLIGAVVNTLLAIAKIAGGFAGHSQALIADGIHSFSDLATDGLVLISAKHGSKEADEDHPYGHGRIETAATVALGILLILVGLTIIYDAYERLLEPDQTQIPHLMVIIIAAASVLSKEGLYHYTLKIAKQLRSNLLHANAWHHRTDSISSFIVIIGVAGAMMAWPTLDTIAAIVVAIMIIHIGWKLAYASIQELVDTAVHPDRIAAIRKTIEETNGVNELHMLRTRRMGGNALVDVHILVNSKLSVSEGHLIGEKVRENLVAGIEEVTDVTVHIDPEDDETSRPSAKLPTREQFLEQLASLWAHIPETSQITDVRLHYLEGRIHVEVTLPLTVAKDIKSAKILSQDFSCLAEQVDEIAAIKVYFN